MLLIQIRDYIHQQGEVSLASLASHFELPQNALIEMVKYWIVRNCIIEINDSEQNCQNACKTNHCSGCQSSVTSIATKRYRWVS